MPIELIESDLCALESQAIDFGALDAYWSAIGVDCDDRAEVLSDPLCQNRMRGYLDATAKTAPLWAASMLIDSPEVAQARNRAMRELMDNARLVHQPRPQVSRGTTAPTCSGLTLAATDGERLGRLAWTPGAQN